MTPNNLSISTSSSIYLHDHLTDHTNKDYPVGVYYVEPQKMFLGHVMLNWHEEIEIDYVKSGRAFFHIGKNTIELKEGQAIIIAGNELHAIYPINDEPSEILSIVFNASFVFPERSGDVYEKYYLPIHNYNTCHYLVYDKKNLWDRSIISNIEDIISANLEKEYGYELVTKSLLCQMWVVFSFNKEWINKKNKNKGEDTRTLSPDEIRVKDGVNFITEHYSESISLDDIADAIHISKSECCRCFKRVVKLSPFEYLMHYRIYSAAEMIFADVKSQKSIAELATSVGFNNTSYFNKLFKEYMGYTPTEYRKLSKTEHRDSLSHHGLSLSHI